MNKTKRTPAWQIAYVMALCAISVMTVVGAIFIASYTFSLLINYMA